MLFDPKFITTIDFKMACSFVNKHHRHNKAPQGHKVSFGLFILGILRGVVIIGRPISRFLDDGYTLEITRCCTDGSRNACSMLIGYACRYIKSKGFKKVITYVLQTETGSSLLACGFKLESKKCGGIGWSNRKNRKEYNLVFKKRFSKIF